MMHPLGKMCQYWSVSGNNKQNVYFVGYSNQYCTSYIIKIDHIKESISPKKNNEMYISLFFILKPPKTVKIALN